MNPLTESSCKNCSNVLPPTALFCPNCGQKNSNGKITVKEFIGEFFESVLNLDSRIIKTLGSIFIPARLTVEYFKGKHKKYVHPLRLFFIVAVGHFSILGIISNSQIGNIKTTMDGIDRQIIKSEVYELIEEYEQGIIKKKTKRKELLILDSLRLFLEERGDVVIDSSSFLTVPSLNTDSMTVDFVEIKEIDAILLSHDELIEKHNIESSFSKLWLRQAIKVDKNPKSAILFGIGNIIWMLFVLIPVVALFMKLLFIRRSKYYIEHLVFLYHWHVSGFIIMSVYFLLMPTIHPSFVAPFILSVLGFGFVALRRYYRQGFFKSFVKYILLLCSYLATAIILLILSSIVSLMVF